MTRILLLSGLLISSIYSSLSQKATISGYIQDEKNKEVLIGANIFATNGQSGVNTNNFGFYSYTLPQGEYEIVVSYIGYQSDTIDVSLHNDTTINIALDATIELETIEIEADKVVNNDRIGMLTLSAEQLKTIPALGGEADISSRV